MDEGLIVSSQEFGLLHLFYHIYDRVVEPLQIEDEYRLVVKAKLVIDDIFEKFIQSAVTAG